MSGGSSETDDDADGDEQASNLPQDFEAAYLSNRELLHRIGGVALRPAGLEFEAGYVVQQAIIGLWKSPPANPGNWLALMLKAVKWRATDLIRSKDVKHAGRSLDDPDNHDPPAAPADFTGEHENRALVRAAIRRLPEQQRDLIHRLFYQGHSQAEVARDLGLTPGRISQIKTAALTELEIAAAMYSDSTLQGVIKDAVDAYLEKQRRDQAFVHAVEAARRRRII